MGHDLINAAIIYQHATNEAGQAIANALDVLLREQKNADHGAPGRQTGDLDDGA